MPRITEKNKRFRTKNEICNDLSFVLMSDISYGTKFAVISEITWVWSEFYGKYEGCKYWSKEALIVKNDQKKLIHEHLVPKKVLIDYLIKKEKITPKEIMDFLNKFCIGVVVTKEEDNKINYAGLRSKMPNGWKYDDPWARYKGLNIEVIKFN